MAMSGVTAGQQVVSALNDLRLKKSRYVVLSIDDGKTINVTQIGPREKDEGDDSSANTFTDFTKLLATKYDNVPCYVGYDFEYYNSNNAKNNENVPTDRMKYDKLILIL